VVADELVVPVVVPVVVAVVVTVVVAVVDLDVVALVDLVVAEVDADVADVLLVDDFVGMVPLDEVDCTDLLPEVGLLWLELPPLVPPDPPPKGQALACPAVITMAAVNAVPAATSPPRLINSRGFHIVSSLLCGCHVHRARQGNLQVPPR
jgi:hypothetical protein